MKDLAAIFKDGAEALAQGGERAGSAIIEHYRGIGGGLDKAAGRYRNVEADTEKSLRSITDDGAEDADRATAKFANSTSELGANLDNRFSYTAGSHDGYANNLSPEAKKAYYKKYRKKFNDNEIFYLKKSTDARLFGASGATKDPIDVVTGQVFLIQRDVSLPGILPFALERWHGSGYQYGDLFGVTWSSTLDQRIEIDDDGIHFFVADGRVLHYPVPAAHLQQVLPPRGPRWALNWDRTEDVITVERDDLGVLLHFRQGVRHVSESPAQPSDLCDEYRPLSAMTDQAGNRVSFVYDGEGIPTDIYHSGGYHLVLEQVFTPGGVRISAVRLADPAGGVALPVREFRYDRAGRLTDVLDASGVPQAFEYDDADRITRWIDRNGHSYAYTYRQDGRASAAHGSDGFLDVTLDYDLASRTTTMTDAVGHTTVFHWNEFLNTVRVIDPLGHETRTEHDRFGEVLAHTDQLGQTTRYERDDRGRPLRVIRADGSVVNVVYDESGRPVTMTRAGGSSWHHTYDDAGMLLQVSDPTGATTHYVRDERGRVCSIIDPLGATTTVTCDSAGLPISVSDPGGATSMIRRDQFGRIVALVDPLGATTEMTWDSDGRLLSRRAPDGLTERWEYDPEGNLLARIEPGGATTRYEYGPFDLQVARVDQEGARYAFTYDKELRLIAVTDPLGRRWCYTYDPTGKMTEESDFTGARFCYTYDAAGRLVRMTNPSGQQTVFELNPLGQVLERRSGENVYRFDYDAEGNISRTEGPGTVVEYVRDALGRVLSETLNGATSVNEFDAVGRRTHRRTPSGLDSWWTFDQTGRPVELQSGGARLSFSYDAAGRETRMSLGSTAAVTQAFDQLGRLTGQAVWSYDQSAGEQTVEQSAWHPVQVRNYAYGSNGIPAQVTDLTHGPRQLRWDSRGRPTDLTADTWQESYTYDAVGNLATAAISGARRAGGDDPSGRVDGRDREYGGGRLRRARHDVFEYDAAGRVVRRTRKTLSGQVRSWRYEWDAESRLTAVSTPDGVAWQYTYDALGRRIAKRATGAEGSLLAEVSFVWDGMRLSEQYAVGADGRTTVTTWDYRPGTFTSLAQTRRDWGKTASAREADREFHAVVADLVGRPVELVSPDGRIAWHSTATLFGETITPMNQVPESVDTAAGHRETANCPLRFPGQYHDDETGLDYNYHRYYDAAAAQYLSPDPLGLRPGPLPYAYVGNPMTRIDPLGLCPSIPGGTAPKYLIDENGVSHVQPIGRPDNDVVFSGHGGIKSGDTSMVTVPEGTALNVYSNHRETITNHFGMEIEAGNTAVPLFTFMPGDKLPDYRLSPPAGLKISGSPITVASPTRLSDLLKPNMGQTHWAACRSESYGGSYGQP